MPGTYTEITGPSSLTFWASCGLFGQNAFFRQSLPRRWGFYGHGVLRRDRGAQWIVRTAMIEHQLCPAERRGAVRRLYGIVPCRFTFEWQKGAGQRQPSTADGITSSAAASNFCIKGRFG